ncbi:MAG TPA: efflux RND transporter permease subunit [Thermohalobaculum sp.]|nr:efflux RND transporter permease subunit [Thermohalobaculum sp.]
MRTLIEAAFGRSRTVLLLLLLTLIAGATSYLTIPKESAPDIPIPVIYVSISYQGIAPEDSERLLIRPMETEMQSLEGLDELKATAAEGYASIVLEFEPGFDADEALDAVREAVDRAEPELPAGAEEPVVREVNVALFPILTAVLSGPVPERTLVTVANELKDRIETIRGVLEVDIGGEREEMVEVLVDPAALESYGISYEAVLQGVERNNQLIAAGAIDTGAGRLTLKVPGVIETLDDVLDLPVKVENGTVVTLRDLALVRRTFEDPQGFARIAGQPAVSLEIKKRLGANIIETVAAIRAAIERASGEWPAALDVVFLQDESEQIETMLGDLENNVLSAILLVMLVIVATLGWRSALLVGLAIPGSFLAGIAIMNLMGFTLNIVVLFSLILVVGMLVDGAIVTSELADRRMAEGRPPHEAYSYGAQRMAWPIIASTVTTLCVFLPLLFWQGIVGEFMKFLPITVIMTLSASLAMALVFIPVLGGLVGRPSEGSVAQVENFRAAESGDLGRIGGATGAYVRLLGSLLRRPGTVLIAALGLLIGSIWAYGNYGRGVEFFPEIEPEVAQIQVKSRDNVSVWEKDDLVRRAEAQVFGIEGIDHIYSRTIGGRRGASELAEDVIG